MVKKLAIFDVIVVGAGLAGLNCARVLHQKGLKVVVLDKSRGLGGRVATRRVEAITLDHGLPALTIQGEHTQALIESMVASGQIEPWSGFRYLVKADGSWQLLSDQYWYCPGGMTGIGKYLAQDLEIYRSYLLSQFPGVEGKNWSVVNQEGVDELLAPRMVLAIPAPQILNLVPPEHPLVKPLSLGEYEPCITVMAAYEGINSRQPWCQLLLENHPEVRMVILNSTKHPNNGLETIVLHSSPSFGESYLDAPDFSSRGESLLQHLPTLGVNPSSPPVWSQVHRWRYAFPRVTEGVPYLSQEHPLPLVCCGDWCLGNLVEGALSSGKQAADFLLI